MNLMLAPGLLEKIIEHAQACYPREGCGLLAGDRAATRLIAVSNASTSASEYEMDPPELISALRGLRNTGEQLVAIYHSHPHGPARPSKTDIERAYYPDAAHLIVSLADRQHPQTAAFRISDGEVLAIEVHVIV